jgi:cardiolipin synthase
MPGRSDRSIDSAIRKLSGLKNRILLPPILRRMRKLSMGGLSGGNSVRLITDGDTCFDSFIRDIRAAKHSINIETFIFNSDEVGWRIAKELSARAKAGVEVNCIYDEFGSLHSNGKIFAHMRKHGVEVIGYHPLAPWRKFSGLTVRNHRKLLVVDGKTAYIGGVNISGDYAGKKYGGGDWRDTHLRITGPAVRDLQFHFIESWYRHGGSIVDNSLHFPDIPARGNKILLVLSTKSRKRIRPIFESYLSAIRFAKKSIYITNAYFVPDRRIHRRLVKAAKRGVDVRLILPGVSDVPIVKYASRYLYRYYLEHGIKVYEYQERVLHAKTAVIDGIWSTVGSSNLDRLSLLSNLELNVAVLDSGFGQEMENVFEKDLERCIRITPELYCRRSLSKFLLEWLAYRFRRIL